MMLGIRPPMHPESLRLFSIYASLGFYDGSNEDGTKLACSIGCKSKSSPAKLRLI